MNPRVDQLLDGLAHPLRAEIDALRAIILASDQRIVESVKWNGPSFATSVDFAAIRLRPLTAVSVVLHTGVHVRPTPLNMAVEPGALELKWAAPDRCQVLCGDLAAILAAEADLRRLVQQWIAQV